MKFCLRTFFFLFFLSFFLGCSSLHSQTDQPEDLELRNADVDDSVIKLELTAENIDETVPDIPLEKYGDFLENRNTRRVQYWIKYFTQKQRERFQRFINNGEEYRHHIEKIFEEQGLPKELYYVGLIESGYYLGARSHASAVGPWQFIKGTGKRYGLKITSEVDERRDLFKASRAAAEYFKDLYNIFLSWELALSAYNAGEFGIVRRIMRHGTRDYYELSRSRLLPRETINYVPKVLAAMHVIENAEKYGFLIPEKETRFYDETELVKVEKNLSLKRIAKKLKISLKELKKLNPELKRSRTPRYLAGDYYLRLPLSSDKNEIKGLRPKRNHSYRMAYHRVRRGETLSGIARKYKLSLRSLVRINNLKSSRTPIRIGQRLALKKSRSSRTVATRSVSPIAYKVHRGDSLLKIAKMFKTSVRKIKRLNKLRGSKIVAGQKILLPGTKKKIYVVKSGDYLSHLARKHNLPLSALRRINALKSNVIYPGQKIIVNAR
jgi:membrane-bound lytic murein transglycosylase D